MRYNSTLSLSRREVAQIRSEARERFGVNYLLSLDSDPKTAKSNKRSDKYLTVIHYLAPATIGGFQVCQWASAGCLAACLHTAGNPTYMRGKERARINRKRLYFEDRDLFKLRMLVDIEKYRKLAFSVGRKLAVRLNGTSDIVWERIWPELFATYRDVKFYDYTKAVKRMRPTWELPRNYDLTFSRSESNHATCLQIMRDNPRARCSIVFSQSRFQKLPTSYDGIPVSDGDLHDMTFLRRAGWLGLRAKGKARRDTSGFVVHAN